MPINRVYHTWLQALSQLQPKQRITVLRNFAWLMAGLYVSGSIHLSRIADEISWRVKLPSATRRLSRLLANRALRVREWYEPIAGSTEKRLKTGKNRPVSQPETLRNPAFERHFLLVRTFFQCIHT